MDQWAAVVLLLLCAAGVHGSTNVYHTGGSNEMGISVQAVFNHGGVIGQVRFSQARPDAPVIIQVDLEGLDQFSDDYRWSVHEFPIRSSLLRNFPCTDAQVGGVYNPLATSPAVGDFTSRYGPLHMQRLTFTDPNLTLFGSKSIIGRSLVIDREDGPAGAFICANIEQKAVRNGELKTLRAGFDNGIIHGDVIFRFAEGQDDVTIEADIYGVAGMEIFGQDHFWSLNFGRVNSTCGGGLGQIYGSAAYKAEDFSCSMERQRECRIGDLTSKCGPLDFSGRRAHLFCTDSQLGTISCTQLFDEKNYDQRLTVRIGGSDGSNANLGCAPLELINTRSATARFSTPSISGTVQFWQHGPDDRTYIRPHIIGLGSTGPFSLVIFEGRGPESDPCNRTSLGSIHTRQGRAFSLPITTDGIPTSDSCRLGGLDVLLPLEGASFLQSTTSSSFLPLFGPYRIVGRTLALVREDGSIAACSPIMCQGCTLGRLSSLLGYQDLNNPSLQ